MPTDLPARSCTDAADDGLTCKKTGTAMTWDQASCPNLGKPCGYRAECQIQVVQAEMKDESN